jgi:hypothetical protein
MSCDRIHALRAAALRAVGLGTAALLALTAAASTAPAQVRETRPAGAAETSPIPHTKPVTRRAWRPDPQLVRQPTLRTPRAVANRAVDNGAADVTDGAAPGEWASWALVDRRTGQLRSGGDGGTTSTESMVKAWIGADFLAGLGARQPTAAEFDLLRRMIRDSDDNAAERLYRFRGGDAVIRRLISICGLTGTRIRSGWWSLTQISAGDAARMGDCVADGRAAGPRWTGWLLGEMRQVRGEGRFGVVEAHPVDGGQPVAVKNGWTAWGGSWHVNCLAVADGWSLAVLTRYPAGRGLGHGAEICRTVTRQLLR